jgi:hypothetical protein
MLWRKAQEKSETNDRIDEPDVDEDQSAFKKYKYIR